MSPGNLVSRATAGLKKLGVKGRRQGALVMPNCPQHVVAFHAALRLGAVVVEHNAVLPMFHAYGLTLCMTFALTIGAKLVLFPTFDVDLVLKAHRKSAATFLPAVPPIYDRIAAAAAERGIGLESIRFSISGATNFARGHGGDVGEGDRRLPHRRLRPDGNFPYRHW